MNDLSQRKSDMDARRSIAREAVKNDFEGVIGLVKGWIDTN
jgi:hypothetical protein